MIKYRVYLIEAQLEQTQEKILPIVIPIVVYTRKKRYPYRVNIFDLFGEHKVMAEAWMFSRCKLIDLSCMPDDALRSHRLSGILEMLK